MNDERIAEHQNTLVRADPLVGIRRRYDMRTPEGTGDSPIVMLVGRGKAAVILSRP